MSAHRVEYLLIGGYAVGYHGYPRATADMDLWIARTPANAGSLLAALREFGFPESSIPTDAFLEENKIIRMGVPPMRIEIITSISGVAFEDCYRERVNDTIDGVEVNIISLARLKENKRAAGRLKDLADLEQLP